MMPEREFISTVFVVDDNKVLLTWNKKVKTWIPVGGHIDSNELPCQSVIREAKEESGLDIELVSPYDRSVSGNLIQPVHMHLDNVKPDHEHINLIYFARVKGGKMAHTSDEDTPNRFLTKEEIKAADLLPNVREWALDAIDKVR